MNIIFTITTTAIGLIAGLFYAWSCSVVPGLQRLPDPGYISAMQTMNKAILNPVFFASFIGTAFLLPLSTLVNLGQPVSARFWLFLSAALVYLIGVFGVTMAGNVPLNNALDAFTLNGASIEEISAARSRFEGPWNALNNIRTLAAVLSLVLTIIACLRPPVKPV